VFVLDENMRKVKPGDCGELYLGGSGLARGYHRNPELTASRFVPSPFADESGTRLYRTGDLVRLRQDGCLEYIERNDYQVKMRGYRIELGEVESALREHPQISQAVVIVQGEGVEKRLVAFVTGHNLGKESQSDVFRFLRKRIPPYMLPSALITLPQLPLTANGKVDRNALSRSIKRKM
jgi:acyl-coenzyme A synthetase/AMP-(fatty) acid ligase